MKMKMKGLIVLLALGTVASLNVFALGGSNGDINPHCYHIIKLVNENGEFTGITRVKDLGAFEISSLDILVCEELVLQDDENNVGLGKKEGQILPPNIQNLTHICNSKIEGGSGAGPFY